MAIEEDTRKRSRVAKLLADNELTDQEIADRLGLSMYTVVRWKNRPTIARRVKRLRERYGTALENTAIARKVRRVKAMQSRWEAMEAIRVARATDAAFAGVPGGQTGFLKIVRYQRVGKGKQPEPIYGLDRALLAEFRALERQAAQELGDIAVAEPGITVNIMGDLNLRALSEEELLAYRALLAKMREKPVEVLKVEDTTDAKPDPA